MGRLDHPAQGPHADPLQDRHNHLRFRRLQFLDVRRAVVHRARHPLLSAGFSAQPLRPPGPRHHRGAAWDSGSRSAPWCSSSASWPRYTCSEARVSISPSQWGKSGGPSPCAVRGPGSKFDAERRAAAAVCLVSGRLMLAPPSHWRRMPHRHRHAPRPPPPPAKARHVRNRSAAGSIRARPTSAITCAAPSARWTISATTRPPTARTSRTSRQGRPGRGRCRQERGGCHQECDGSRDQTADRTNDERSRAMRKRAERRTRLRRGGRSALPQAWICLGQEHGFHLGRRMPGQDHAGSDAGMQDRDLHQPRDVPVGIRH